MAGREFAATIVPSVDVVSVLIVIDANQTDSLQLDQFRLHGFLLVHRQVRGQHLADFLRKCK
jgi:hypothetical protein